MKHKNTQKEYIDTGDFKTYVAGATHIPVSLTIESIYCAHATEKSVHLQGDTPTPGPPLYGIYITTKGSGFLEKRDGSRVKLTEGTVYFFIHQELQKLYSTSEHWDYLVYYFRTDNLELPLNQIYKLQPFNKTEEEVFCNRLIRLFQTNLSQNIQKANALLCARAFTWMESALTPIEAKKEEHLDKIMAYINANIYEALHVNKLAEDLGLNVKYVQRLFEEKLNVTPKQFISDIKLRMVYSLLKASNLSIKDIAKICSFSTPSHLVNSFKQAEGISPARYRKNYLANQ